MYANKRTTFPGKCPSSSHLGGKHKFSHFYPQIDSCPAYFGADTINKSDYLLFVRVNYEDPKKKSEKWLKRKKR